MWGQLGSSALGSNSLRNSLSESNIPSRFRKKSSATEQSFLFSRKTSSPVPTTVVASQRSEGPFPPTYPPPPIPSSPSPSSLSAASSGSSGHSSLDFDSHSLSKRHVERHVAEQKPRKRDQKSAVQEESVSAKTGSVSTQSSASSGTATTTRKRETTVSGSEDTDSSGDEDPANLIQRGGFARNSLLRSGRCISMPSIANPVVTVAISPPATPPPVLRKAAGSPAALVIKKAKKKKSRDEDSSAGRKCKGTTPSPADDSGVYHLHQTHTPSDKGGAVWSSEANTPSSGIDVATTVAATTKDRDSTLLIPTNGSPAQAQGPPADGSKKQSRGKATNGGGSHERNFRRRFPKAGPTEELVDHYSCALVADILLQGVLYITNNYFAFYSNIFGFKTQLLIPIQSVLKVTKERTVKIIPNAVGIKTEERKYVFGSLLSRDATFKTLLAVWSKSVDPEVISLIEDSETDNNSNAPAQPGSEEELEEFQRVKLPRVGLVPDGTELPVESVGAGSPLFSSAQAPSTLQFGHGDPGKGQDVSLTKKKEPNVVSSCHWFPDLFLKVESIYISFNKLPKTSLMLLISTFLLVLLFASASVLIFRIALVHRRISTAEKTQPEWVYRLNAYHDIFKRQNQALSDEVLQLTGRLKETIDQLNQMRRPLEDLFASSAFVQGSFCKNDGSAKAKETRLRDKLTLEDEDEVLQTFVEDDHVGLENT